MAVATTIYLQTATIAGITFSAGAGGPIMGEYSHSGEPLEDRTADNEYPPFLAVVNKKLIVRLRVREVKQAMALGGAAANGSFTLTGKSNTVTINFANLVVIAVEPGEQSRAQAGSATIVLQHQSADGTTVPIT